MNETSPTILIVDDKPNMVRLLTKVLKQVGRVLSAERGNRAISLLQENQVDVVLCDLRMPDISGIEVLKACKQHSPKTEFILMTAYSSVETAVDALRLGAYDYLTKPFEPDLVRGVVHRAMGRAARYCEDGPDTHEVLPDVIARSESMQKMGRLVRLVAESDATVVVMGETGTGKERVSRAIHRLSSRSTARFVAVNCAAIPGELLESELFGYSKGSFTGATQTRTGLFEEADKGTLFLDEIGDMRLSLQAKLTRALEERTIRRLGDSVERPVDVRLIAATHRDIQSMVDNQDFREDLWYRLNVAQVYIPPLRDREDDIELLAYHFLRELSLKHKRILGITDEAKTQLKRYSWPGNVRQLRSAIERATIVCEAEYIDAGDLPAEISVAHTPNNTASLASLRWDEAQKIAQESAAKAYLSAVLEQHQGQVDQAAAHAGVKRESFYRLMRRFNVSAEDGR